MKRFPRLSLTLGLVFCFLTLIGTGISYADNQDGGLAPNSPFYFIDRLQEDIAIVFMSPEDKVGFYFDLAGERFEEAVVMFENDDSDRAFELLGEGLKNISEALKSWKICLDKDIEKSGVKEQFNEVFAQAKETFQQIKKDLNMQRIVEITKEIATITKEQIELLFTGD